MHFVPWWSLLAVALLIGGLVTFALKGKDAADQGMQLLDMVGSEDTGFVEYVSVFKTCYPVTLGVAGGVVAASLLVAGLRLNQRLRREGRTAKQGGRCALACRRRGGGLGVCVCMGLCVCACETAVLADAYLWAVPANPRRLSPPHRRLGQGVLQRAALDLPGAGGVCVPYLGLVPGQPHLPHLLGPWPAGGCVGRRVGEGGSRGGQRTACAWQAQALIFKQ